MASSSIPANVSIPAVSSRAALPTRTPVPVIRSREAAIKRKNRDVIHESLHGFWESKEILDRHFWYFGDEQSWTYALSKHVFTANVTWPEKEYKWVEANEVLKELNWSPEAKKMFLELFKDYMLPHQLPPKTGLDNKDGQSDQTSQAAPELGVAQDTRSNSEGKSTSSPVTLVPHLTSIHIPPSIPPQCIPQQFSVGKGAASSPHSQLLDPSKCMKDIDNRSIPPTEQRFVGEAEHHQKPSCSAVEATRTIPIAHRSQSGLESLADAASLTLKQGMSALHSVFAVTSSHSFCQVLPERSIQSRCVSSVHINLAQLPQFVKKYPGRPTTIKTPRKAKNSISIETSAICKKLNLHAGDGEFTVSSKT